jgi:hypothetical protein
VLDILGQCQISLVMLWTAPATRIAMCQLAVSIDNLPMSGFVKGCRTPAVTGRLARARSAGVGQASGEETAGRDGRGGAAGYGDLTAGCGRRRFGGRDADGLRRVGADNRSTSEQVLASCRRDRRAWRGGKPGFARALWWPAESWRYVRSALSRWISGIVVMGWRSRSRRSAARVVRCRVRRSR